MRDCERQGEDSGGKGHEGSGDAGVQPLRNVHQAGMKTRFDFRKGSVLRRRLGAHRQGRRATGARVFDSTLKPELLGSRKCEPFGVAVGLGSEMTEGGGEHHNLEVISHRLDRRCLQF